MATVQSNIAFDLEPELAWARLFHMQGQISEEDYLRLTEHTRQLVELAGGKIEVLTMPTVEHQRILLFLVDLLRAFVTPRKLGEVIIAAYRVRVGNRRFREPDIVFMLQSKLARLGSQFAEGADLVVEVVSEDDPDRDLIVKREEYAQAGIAEYWIVDPRTRTITVLRLENGEYATHSDAAETGQVRSALLDGFTADVGAVFAAARPK
jgi:Uma2 family endonuclease